MFNHKFDDQIPQFRQSVLDKIRDEKPEIYAEDIDRVSKSDKLLRRFLEYNAGDVKVATEKIINSFIIQKQFNLRDKTDAHFPREIWTLGGLKIYGHDKNDNLILYFRMKYLRKEKCIRELVKQGIVYHFWKLEERSTEREDKNSLLIVDFAGLQLSQFYLEICMFCLSMKDVFPLLLEHLIVLNVPWFARTFLQTVKFALPAHVRDMLLFLPSVNDLKEYIDEHQMPYWLNGLNTIPFDGMKAVPEGSPSAYSYAIKQLKMEGEEALQLKQLADKLIDEYFGSDA